MTQFLTIVIIMLSCVITGLIFELNHNLKDWQKDLQELAYYKQLWQKMHEHQN